MFLNDIQIILKIEVILYMEVGHILGLSQKLHKCEMIIKNYMVKQLEYQMKYKNKLCDAIQKNLEILKY